MGEGETVASTKVVPVLSEVIETEPPPPPPVMILTVPAPLLVRVPLETIIVLTLDTLVRASTVPKND
jgi:hypothetical protein